MTKLAIAKSKNHEKDFNIIWEHHSYGFKGM